MVNRELSIINYFFKFAVFGFKLTSDFRYIVSVSNKFITWDVSTSDLARQVHPGKLHGVKGKLIG
jgi:hypothetical protein